MQPQLDKLEHMQCSCLDEGMQVLKHRKEDNQQQGLVCGIPGADGLLSGWNGGVGDTDQSWQAIHTNSTSQVTYCNLDSESQKQNIPNHLNDRHCSLKDWGKNSHLSQSPFIWFGHL